MKKTKVRLHFGLFLYICDMKIYVITVTSDGAVAVLSAMRNKAMATNLFDQQTANRIGEGYTVQDEYSQDDIDLLNHVELMKDDINSPTYDFDLWEVDLI